MSDFYKGEEQLLYLTISGIDYPIGCLTENSFSETADMIETTTVDNAGWKTSRPTNQSYSISFTGIQVLSDVIPLVKVSYDVLKSYKRGKTRVIWKKEVSGVFTETGEGYIKDLSEAAAVGDYLTFDGTIEGYGEPTDANLYTYEDGNQVIFND